MGLPSARRAPAPKEPVTPPPPEPVRTGRFARHEEIVAPELPPEEEGRPKSARGAYLRLIVYGGIAIGLGWLVAQYGLVPGLFLVSDIALPTLLAVALQSATQLLRFHVRDRDLRESAATITKATQWSIILFWAAWNLTKVPQLAFGLAGGLIAYALVGARLRLRTAGFAGCGPGLPLSILTLAFYLPWMLFRRVAHDALPDSALGPLGGYDIGSMAFGIVASLILMRAANGLGRKADRTPRRVGLADSAKTRQKASEQRTLAAIVITYLVFRFFISERIPYGPIVEWFLICGGILFFAIVVANRIGVVPTALALPRTDVRRHVQTVSNLPDERLAETQALIEGYVAGGAHAERLHALLLEMYTQAGLPPDVTDAALAPFRAVPDRKVATAKETRAAAVRRALETLKARRDRSKTLKGERPVRSERATGPITAPTRG